MALKYIRRADGMGTGSRLAVGPIGVFNNFYQDGPLNQAYVIDPGISGKGEGLFADWSQERIGLIRNGVVTYVAGVRGATGYRDGPGKQALFSIGSGGYPVNSLVMTSPSVGYVTDGYNNAIRKLEEQPDGTWNVSTFRRTFVTVMTADSLGNLWFPDGGNLVRIAPDGTESSVAALRQRTDTGNMLIYSMCADRIGNVYLTDNINAASVFYKCGQDMVIHHLCGIDQAEMNQIADSGLPEFMDGDADHCTFHHDNVVMASDDGTEVYMGGGDENFIRRFKDGQSMTLGSDGYWHSFPFHVDIGYILNFAPAGWDDEPKRSIFITLGSGYPAAAETWLIFKSLDLVESTDLPFQLLSAEFTDWKNIAIPFKMVAGQTYNFNLAFANGGDAPWTKADGWRMVGADTNPFGVPDQQLGDTEQVLPGQIRHFTFPVTPNVPPGQYLSRFGMGYKNLNVYGMSPGNFTIFATQADLDASNQGGIMQGFLDGADGGVVTGWCVDGATPVSVDIMIDGAVAATIVANASRLDLVTAGVASDPNHGVAWTIPSAYQDGKPHTAGIRYNGAMLPCSSGGGNTKSFTLAAPAPAPTPTPTPVPSAITIPAGTYSFTGTLTSPDGTTNGTITASIVVTNPQPVPGTVTLAFTKL